MPPSPLPARLAGVWARSRVTPLLMLFCQSVGALPTRTSYLSSEPPTSTVVDPTRCLAARPGRRLKTVLQFIYDAFCERAAEVSAGPGFTPDESRVQRCVDAVIAEYVARWTPIYMEAQAGELKTLGNLYENALDYRMKDVIAERIIAEMKAEGIKQE